jgi:hypothetical protein
MIVRFSSSVNAPRARSDCASPSRSGARYSGGMKPSRKGDVSMSTISSMRASRRVDVSTVRSSGPFCSTRRSFGIAAGSLRAMVSSSSPSSTSSSRRQPLRTVRRTSVVSMSATGMPSMSSTEMSVARRNDSLSSTLPSRLSARPRVSALPCRSQ